jgi:hypothetical protein
MVVHTLRARFSGRERRGNDHAIFGRRRVLPMIHPCGKARAKTFFALCAASAVFIGRGFSSEWFFV